MHDGVQPQDDQSRRSLQREREEIEVALQAILDEAFNASSDSVFVGWGVQSESDTIRMHHVPDVNASVGHRQALERPPALKPGIAGHTSKRGKLVGSEFLSKS